MRFNSFVGVTLAAGLFGAPGVALAATCVAVLVPTVNLLCVLVFARHGAARATAPGIARAVASNPLVLGCSIGGVLQATGTGSPAAVEPVLRALGQASLPLGLLCVGAALELGPARGWLRPLLAASVAKFALMPLAAALACAGLGLHGHRRRRSIAKRSVPQGGTPKGVPRGVMSPKGDRAATATLLFQALPTASSSYILARQLGGDAPLMAAITAVRTVLAAAAIPLALAALPVPPG